MVRLIFFELLITILFITCNKQSNSCFVVKDIAMKQVVNFIETLDSVDSITPSVIELQITENADFFIGNVFVSGVYIRGNKIPIDCDELLFKNKSVHVLTYCYCCSTNIKDSLVVLEELGRKKLIANNVVDAAQLDEWSTNDFYSLKFVFCKEDVSIFSTTTRLDEIQDKVPHCIEIQSKKNKTKLHK